MIIMTSCDQNLMNVSVRLYDHINQLTDCNIIS